MVTSAPDGVERTIATPCAGAGREVGVGFGGSDVRCSAWGGAFARLVPGSGAGVVTGAGGTRTSVSDGGGVGRGVDSVATPGGTSRLPSVYPPTPPIATPTSNPAATASQGKDGVSGGGVMN